MSCCVTDLKSLREELDYLAGQCQKLGDYYVVRRDFLKNQDQIELLQKVAGRFFYTALVSADEAFFLCAARLLDREKSCGNDNMSIEGFFARWRTNGTCSQRAEEALQRLQSLREKSEIYRNKFLAHNDLNSFLENEPDTGWNEDDFTSLMRDLQTIVDEACCSLNLKCFDRIFPEHSEFGLQRLINILNEATETDDNLLKRRIREDLRSKFNNIDHHRRETLGRSSDTIIK